jgi:undecaprenyl diphosphate synthase
MPLSLSFVPDGNRRWAKEKNKNTIQGHTAGAKKIEEITKWLKDNIEVDECVFWCLSRSNLERDQDELDGIFYLLKHYFDSMRKSLVENQIAFLALGEIHLLPDDIQAVIKQLEEDTKHFIERRRLGFGLAYDRDYDMIQATKKVLEKYPEISDPKDIEKLIRTEGGYARGMRDPDILVRTGAKK